MANEELEVNTQEICDAVNEKQNEYIEIFSNEQVSLVGNLQLDVKSDKPIITIHFSIQNKDDEKMLPSLHMQFAESFDLKLTENDDDANTASATEHFELQANEKVSCDARFEIIGTSRKGLCVRGDLFYDVEVR